MADIKFEFKGPNGERYNSAKEMFDSLTGHVTELAFEHGVSELEKLAMETIKDLRCAEHGATVAKINASRSGSEANLAIEGCCERFVESSRAAIADALKE
jgi:hypothetical protein